MDAVTKLIKDGVDPNAVDYEGRAPLHLAAQYNAVDVVRYLCDSHSAVDPSRLTMISRQTPLQCAPASATEVRKIISARMKQLQGPGHVVQDDTIFEANKIESTEVVNPKVMRKVIIVVLLPFVTLIFINGLVFGLKFLLCTIGFYFVLVGYFISEITIKPPWYHHHPNSTELTGKGCPEYWLGLTHNPRVDFGLDFSDVVIHSTDGYLLSAWHVPPPEGCEKDVAVVLVHGGGRDRRAWLRHIPMFHKGGYGAVLFDFREHGLSTGNCNGFTYGMKERFDVIAAAKYCKIELGYRRVVVVGTSVGGSSVLMAAAVDAQNIDGVVAENAITTCAVLQDHVLTNLLGGYFSRHWISVKIFNIFRLTCSMWLNYRIGNKPSKHCQALHCIDRISPRPVLLMHGTSDEVVPMQHSVELFQKAQEPKSLWMCEGAFHCCLYNKDPREFEHRVLTLLQQVRSTIHGSSSSGSSSDLDEPLTE